MLGNATQVQPLIPQPRTTKDTVRRPYLHHQTDEQSEMPRHFGCQAARGLANMCDFQCMNGVPKTSGEMVRSALYDWETRAMSTVETRMEGDEYEVKKKTTKVSTGLKNGSTGTKKTNKAKKKSFVDPSSGKGGGGNLLAPAETEVDWEVWSWQRR